MKQVPIEWVPWREPSQQPGETSAEHRRRSYTDYMDSPQWASKREELFRAKGKQCKCCYSTDEIQVHHLTYERFGAEDLEDLMPLCKFCHEELTEEWQLLRRLRMKTGSLKDWTEKQIGWSHRSESYDEKTGTWQQPKGCIHVINARRRIEYAYEQRAATGITCPRCGSQPGAFCVSVNGNRITEVVAQHAARRRQTEGVFYTFPLGPHPEPQKHQPRRRR